MKRNEGYRVVPFTANRRMVAASAAVSRERSTVHGLCEVDVTEPRRLLREHRDQTGEGLSLTALVVACVARAVAENPGLNAFRRGRKLVLLDDVTIGTLIERATGTGTVPELLPIHAAQAKSFRQIHDEIRAAQERQGDRVGGPSATNALTRFVPDPILRLAVRAATRSITRTKRSGVVAVTSVGRFGGGPGWGIPLSVWTVAVTVGGISRRPVIHAGGPDDTREWLCLTVSFDHDIVDGAPAARFMTRLAELLRDAEPLKG